MTKIRHWWHTRHHEDVQKLEETKAELDRVQRQWPVIHEVVALLKHHRERNGFSESIASIYRGGRS